MAHDVASTEEPVRVTNRPAASAGGYKGSLGYPNGSYAAFPAGCVAGAASPGAGSG